MKEDINDIMMENQKLINEAHRKLGLDSLFVFDHHVYPEGHKPRLLDSKSYIDHFGTTVSA